MTLVRTLRSRLRDPGKGFGTRAGLYRTVLTVTVVLVLGIMGGAGVGVWYLHVLSLEKASEDTTRVAVLGAERTSQAFSVTDHALLGVRGMLRILPATSLADPKAFNRLLHEQVAALPHLRALFVTDARGTPRFSSDGPSSSRAIAGMEAFRFHIGRHDDRLYIGSIGPDPATGLRTTMTSRALFRADGTFDGIVLAETDPQYALRLFDKTRLGLDSRMQLIADDGRVLVSLPPSLENRPLENRGKPNGSSPSQTAPGSQSAAPASRTSNLPDRSLATDASTDTTRILVREPIPGYAFTLELSRNRTDQLAPWRRTSIGIAVWTVLAAAATIVLSGLLLRQLKQRESAEEALVANRSLLQLVFDTVPHALYVKDLSGKLLLVNEESARLCGRPAEDLVGKVLSGLGPPDSVTDADRARIAATDAQVLAEGRPVRFEIQRTLGGDLRTLQVIKAPIRNAAGAIESMLLLAADVTEERRGQRELEQSRESLHLIFDMIPYSMLFKDRSGRIVMANAAAGRTHRRDPTTLIGKRTPDLIAIASEQERIQDTDEQVMRTGAAGEFQIERQFPQGLRTFRVQKMPVRDSAGAVSGVLSLSEDVTDHLAALDQLSESRNLLKLIFDTIPHAVLIKDLEGRTTIVNAAAGGFAGMDPQAMIGLMPQELFPNEQIRKQVDAMDARAIATGESFEYDLKRDMPNGQRMFRVLKVPMRDGSGAISGTLSLSEDVTERRLAAEKLKESETLLSLIFETFPHSLILRDLEGRLMMINSAAAKPLGMDPASLLGKRLQDFFPPEDWAPAAKSDHEVMTTGRSVSYELQRTFDGVRRTWNVLKAPLRDASGTIRGLVSLSQEVTDLRAAADKLKESEDLLRLIFDTIPYELFYKDLDGRLVIVNKTMTEIWQRPMEQLVGRRLQDLNVDGKAVTKHADEIRRTDEAVARGESVDLEAMRSLPIGARMLRIIKRPLLDAGARVKGILTLSEDVTERRRAEEALRRSQALLQSMLDNIPMHVFLKDLDGRLMVMNKLFAESWQSTPRELAGRRLQDLSAMDQIPDEERRSIVESDARVVAGETVESEVERLMPAGLRRLRAVKVPLRDASGKITNILTISEDVTDKRSAQDELQRSRALLQVVFDTIPVGIILKDMEGRHVLANKFVAGMMGTTPQRMIGTLAHANQGGQPISDEERNLILSTDEQAKAGETVEFELPRLTTIGHRLLRTIKAPVKDDSGQITGVLAVSEDITERRRAEDELRNSRALLQAVFDTIPHHLFVKDRDRRFMAVNHAMATAFQKSPESLIGQLAAETGSAANVEATAMEDRRVLDLGQPADRMTARTMPDGEVHHYHLVKAPMRDDHGRVMGLVGLAEDVTSRVIADQKRIELEAQLQQAQKMELIGRLSAGVAHDFNNLLTPILGHAELLLSDEEVPESGKASAQVIRQATERAAELTRGLLAFGRKQLLDMKPMQVNDAVTSLLPIVRRLLGTGIEIRMDLTSEAGWISGDSSQIQQILLNLAVNARDAMPDGGLIIIGTRIEVLDPRYIESYPGCPPGEYVTLFVSDSGHGMDPETLSRVFEPFFTTKDVGKGTGLGLSIVHGIVEQHGGVIRVYSAVEQGTTFRVFLPRIQIEPGSLPETAAAESTPIPQGHERILVVDDEELIRHLVSTVLQSHGYNVTEALGPEEALGLLNGANPPVDLLVTDLIMPGLNGLALYRKAAAKLPGLRVLYVSGHPKHLLDELGYKGLGEHFLTKPFPVGRLARTVRNILDE